MNNFECPVRLYSMGLGHWAVPYKMLSLISLLPKSWKFLQLFSLSIVLFCHNGATTVREAWSCTNPWAKDNIFCSNGVRFIGNCHCSLVPRLPNLFQTIEHCLCIIPGYEAIMLHVCLSLCSDLCSSFGKNLLPVMSNAHAINELLKEGKRSRIKRTKTLSVWAAKELKTIQSW